MIISIVETRKRVKLVTILDMVSKKKVILGVSGGIDSSTSAFWLLKNGYEVEGVYFDLWKAFSDDEVVKKAVQENYKKLDQLSKKLQFPIQIIDRKDAFKNSIVKYFINAMKDGLTPNPCVLCNKQFKFKILFELLKEMDADSIATGHYARIRLKKDGKVNLLKGLDASKDQSYYLTLLDQETLQKVIFPLGESKKTDIKKIYKQDINPDADLLESQDLCFLTGHDPYSFMEKYAPESLQSGEIVNTDGMFLGEHAGLAFYTIGQRKRLQISAKEAYFVVEKSTRNNRLIVGFKEELGRDSFYAKNVNWISGEPRQKEKQYAVKIRYRSQPVMATVKPAGDSDILEIKLKKRLRDITPGQFAVFYHQDAVIAGGEISYN
ncbi:MAG: tRNA 2-thiouridine(34) synthase MnmA [Anaerolineaceae bacterium]